MRTRKVALDKIPALMLAQPGPGEEEARSPRVQPQLLRLAMEQELTPRQRECVELYFFRRLTMEEVGQELGIGKATVCRHLQKSKERLGKALRYAAGVEKSRPA